MIGPMRSWSSGDFMAERTSRIKVGSGMGFTIRVIGWMFTLGVLDLSFWWRGLTAIVIWPCCLGVHFAGTALF